MFFPPGKMSVGATACHSTWHCCISFSARPSTYLSTPFLSTFSQHLTVSPGILCLCHFTQLTYCGPGFWANVNSHFKVHSLDFFGNNFVPLAWHFRSDYWNLQRWPAAWKLSETGWRNTRLFNKQWILMAGKINWGWMGVEGGRERFVYVQFIIFTLWTWCIKVIF